MTLIGNLTKEETHGVKEREEMIEPNIHNKREMTSLKDTHESIEIQEVPGNEENRRENVKEEE